MKKIISIALCTVIALMGTISVSATEQENKNFFAIITTTEIDDNVIRVYKSGTNIASDSCVVLEDYADSSATVINMPQTTSSFTDASVPSTAGYELFSGFDGSSSNFNRKMCYNNTGGTYIKIKLKLSDFSDYFNEDGTRTHTLRGETHDYNFTDEGDGHTSSLLIISGAANTFAAPDENGYATFYMSPNIGDGVSFKTGFNLRVGNSVSGGGGTSGFALKGLTVGDATENDMVSVDDATCLQKYLANLKTLGTDYLTKFRCDANGDGVINVADATAIQKYLVKK